MGQVEIPLQLPLDHGFLRRECPLCRRQFKVLLREEEMADIPRKGADEFWASSEASQEPDASSTKMAENFCPYCGQPSSESDWWTQEQRTYILALAKNVMLGKVRTAFQSLETEFRGSKFVTVKASKPERDAAWISPETDDMRPFELPCCERTIKIDEDWRGKVHCFFCGFPHPVP